MLENAPPGAGEVRALAHQLLSWANLLSARPAIGRHLTGDEEDELALELAIAARETARLRDRIFPEIAFGNPAWDIALELFIEEANGGRITSERLPLVAYLPSETVERCVEALSRAGLVAKLVDRADPSNQWLALSKQGKSRMTALLLQSARFVWPFSAENGGGTPPAAVQDTTAAP